MKRTVSIGMVASLALLALAACGGGGATPTPTPTPTGNDVKAITGASTQETLGSVEAGALNALMNMAPAAQTVAKVAYSADVDTAYTCTDGGQVGITGTGTANCTEMGESWSCTNMMLDLALAFSDCVRYMTVGSTQYQVILNGPATIDVTGAVSGTGDNPPSEYNFSGSPLGTLTASGDVSGTIDLEGLGVSGSGTGELEDVVTCTGEVTVDVDSTQEVCAVTSDCTSCTL